jgi:ABC-type transport system involved in cytochrome bd biosynthesis fused ATPase/permease subunit
MEAKLSAGEIFSIIDQEPPNNDDGTKPETAIGRIQFDNVEFSYPSREGQVLKRISFVAEPGQKIAIVGQSGSGKSTIANLLIKHYQTTGGTVRLKGFRIMPVFSRLNLTALQLMRSTANGCAKRLVSFFKKQWCSALLSRKIFEWAIRMYLTNR